MRIHRLLYALTALIGAAAPAYAGATTVAFSGIENVNPGLSSSPTLSGSFTFDLPSTGVTTTASGKSYTATLPGSWGWAAAPLSASGSGVTLNLFASNFGDAILRIFSDPAGSNSLRLSEERGGFPADFTGQIAAITTPFDLLTFLNSIAYDQAETTATFDGARAGQWLLAEDTAPVLAISGGSASVDEPASAALLGVGLLALALLRIRARNTLWEDSTRAPCRR